MRDFYESLCEAAGGEAVRADEPMAAHTTFRTGGKAAFFAAVQNEAALRRVTLLCRERGYHFIFWETEATFWWAAGAMTG